MNCFGRCLCLSRCAVQGGRSALLYVRICPCTLLFECVGQFRARPVPVWFGRELFLGTLLDWIRHHGHVIVPAMRVEVGVSPLLVKGVLELDTHSTVGPVLWNETKRAKTLHLQLRFQRDVCPRSFSRFFPSRQLRIKRHARLLL